MRNLLNIFLLLYKNTTTIYKTETTNIQQITENLKYINQSLSTEDSDKLKGTIWVPINM